MIIKRKTIVIVFGVEETLLSRVGPVHKMWKMVARIYALRMKLAELGDLLLCKTAFVQELA